MPRTHKPSGKSRHDPLLVQLDEDEVEAKYGRISQPGKRKKSRQSSNIDEESSEVKSFTVICFICLSLFQAILDPKTSRRIFELAKDQQDELEIPDDHDVDQDIDEDRMAVLSKPRMQVNFEEDDEDDERNSEDGGEIEKEYVSTIVTGIRDTISWDLLQEIDAGDMEALDTFLPANAGERKTLADLIFAKLDSGEVVSTATIQKVHQGA
jgi:essential nuclear protein 1